MLQMARKRTESATEPSEERKARGKFTRAKKCMKTTTKKFHESGKHNSETEEKSPSKILAESLSSLDKRLIHTQDRAQEVPVLDLHSGKKVLPSAKMKLQLFPLDAPTREGLEKEGFHPYLELTLSSRKKISSVLQHIQSKWGSSEVARGNPTLHPYERPVLALGHKWEANSNITIGDVYEAIRAPPLFRLRYGWCSETENKSDKPPSPLTPVTGTPPSDNKPPDGQVESTGNKINDGSGSTCGFWDDGLTSISIGGLLSEVSLKGNFGNHCKSSSRGNANATLWVDDLTNISIGGLFSEASLQGFRNTNREQDIAVHSNNNGQPSGNFGGLLSGASLAEGRFSDCNKTLRTSKTITEQPLPLISGSSDAFLQNRTDHPRAPSSGLPTEPTHSSILDAEDTCHAFSFRKGSTTSPKVCEQVTGELEEQQKDDSKLGSSVFNQDRSLGFSGIKWEADTRGPFDLGFSSSRNLTNGDSISFGAAVKDLLRIDPSEDKTKLAS